MTGDICDYGECSNEPVLERIDVVEEVTRTYCEDHDPLEADLVADRYEEAT